MYIIFNLKQNKNLEESKNYLNALCIFLDKYDSKGIKLIIAPSCIYLDLYNKYLSKYDFVSVSSQDISKFTGGSYTGELSALQVKDFAKYSIVGHSERRVTFGESLADTNSKIKNCQENNITPIVCFSNLEQLTSLSNLDNVLLAYEPIEYIGGSEAINSDTLVRFYESSGLSQKIIYGGSVNDKNVLRFSGLSFLSGFLVGGASLDITKATKILNTIANL